MGGFLGIGGSSAKTDRGQNLGATQGSWNLFSQGLGLGTAESGAGLNTLNQAKSELQPATDYWKSLLTAGRTQTAQNAAPAIDAALAQKDALERARAQFGTGRSGGTVASDAEASTATSGTIDDIINKTQVAGREAGAEGLAKTAGLTASMGGQELAFALSNLGLSQTAIEDIMKNSSTNYQFDTAQAQQTGAAMGQAAGQLVAAYFGL
jgi:hypothetical protein